MRPPVLDRDREDFCFTKRKGLVDQMRFGMDVPGGTLFAVECIKEDPVQVLHGVLRRINRNSAAIERTESTEIVKAHDMIRMRMGIENGIQMLNLRAERLNSELCPGIYHPGTILRSDVDGRPQPPVTGIFGLADLAG